MISQKKKNENDFFQRKIKKGTKKENVHVALNDWSKGFSFFWVFTLFFKKEKRRRIRKRKRENFYFYFFFLRFSFLKGCAVFFFFLEKRNVFLFS